MASSPPIFYLIDGHAVAYRQYFGLPVASFSTKAGEPTNAVYGFTRSLHDLILKIKPDYLAVSFDRGLSGREEIYSEYKGTRDKMPEDLEIQIDRIHQIVEAFNIPVLAIDGWEADDIIGTVAPQIEAEGVNVRIITGDRDLLQLLTDKITVQLPSRNGPDDIYDIAKFTEKYQIRPDQLVDMKALMGDNSDNIPGVKGIGEKTAAKLLQEYDTLENIYANIENIKGSNRTKLETDRELAFISQDLARIRRDAPIQIVLQQCVSHDYDANDLLPLYQELEFRTFASELVENSRPTTQNMFGDNDFDDEDFAPPPMVDSNTIIVRDEVTLKALVETLNAAASITWDVETTGTDQMRVDLVGIALAVDTETGYYIPVGHQKGQQLPVAKVMDALRGPLTNPHIEKYAHNASYDFVVTKRYGLEVQPIAFDTMIAEWVCDPVSKFLGLKNLVPHRTGEYMTEISELIGKGRNQKTMDEVPIEQAASYAAADATMTHKLVTILRSDLEQQGLIELYNTLEIPLIPVITSMEQAGVAIDAGYFKQMSTQLDEQLIRIEAEINALSGGYGEFNINSPKQLNDVLFGKLGLSTEGLKKTTHGYSTDVVTLEKLKADTKHPILVQILEYRELSKLKSTYVDALPELINPYTGRLHTSYNQTGTSTGRISSSNPNLQNIPIRTEIGRDVRRGFIAPPGYVLLAVDYSQIELRVLAHISKDETLLEAFSQGQDIHAATAAAVYGIDVKDVTYEQRSFAKRVNFGLIYGMGAFRLARDSDLTLAEANEFIETYFQRLPRVRDYIEQPKQKARDPEGVRTLFGRVRHFATLENSGSHSNRQAIQAEDRAAINMPIQGTAADIMKRAMIDLHNQLISRKLTSRMILQVHDELVLEVLENEQQAAHQLVVDVMEGAYKLLAPLKANAQVGPNWRDMKGI